MTGDVHIHIGTVNGNVIVPNEHADAPKYTRAPLANSRAIELPVYDLPPEMWSRDEPVAPAIAPRAPDDTPLIDREISERTPETLPVLAPPAPAIHAGRHTFREAAEHYVSLHPRKLSISQEKVWIEELLPFIGALPLERIYDGTLQGFIESQRVKVLKGGKIGVKSKTLALKLGMVRHILRLASMSWRDDQGETWLQQAPLISMPEGGDERPPRQLTWQEQEAHLHKLPEHLHRMALFDLQCGARDDVVCSLRWEWAVPVPDLDDVLTFIVPTDHVKGRKGKKHARVIVCNSVAREIVEGRRGDHPEFVFVYRHGRHGVPRPVSTQNNSAWQKWREECGLGDLHVHDMRHTVGMRLREASVPENTISDVLWHKRASITGHYSVAQVHELHAAVQKLVSPVHANNRTLASIAQERAGT